MSARSRDSLGSIRAGKDRIRVNGHLGWKLGVVLVMTVMLFTAAVLVVRSWAKRTYLQPLGRLVTSSTR